MAPSGVIKSAFSVCPSTRMLASSRTISRTRSGKRLSTITLETESAQLTKNMVFKESHTASWSTLKELSFSWVIHHPVILKTTSKLSSKVRRLLGQVLKLLVKVAKRKEVLHHLKFRLSKFKISPPRLLSGSQA